MGFFGIKQTLGTHRTQIAELCEAQTKLERSMRDLQLDQITMFDKTLRLFGRIAKRAAIDHPEPPVGDEIPRTEQPQIDEISAAIHARRAAGTKQ